MPAKKKAPKMTRGERAAVVIDRWATMASELDRLRKQLTEANEQIKSGEVALLETAKVVSVLNRGLAVERAKLAATQARDDQHLTAIRELVDAQRKERAGAEAEIEYWKGEVTRLHNELIDIQREAARDGVS